MMSTRHSLKPEVRIKQEPSAELQVKRVTVTTPAAAQAAAVVDSGTGDPEHMDVAPVVAADFNAVNVVTGAVAEKTVATGHDLTTSFPKLH